MKWVNYLVLIVVVAVVLPVSSQAQSVNWSPSKGNFEKGTRAQLSLVFKDCDPSSGLRIPQVDGLEIGQPNSRQSHITGLSGILGGKGKTMTIGFPVVAQKEGAVVIPAFKVSTSAGDLEVPEARYQVIKATVSSQTSRRNTGQPQGLTLNLEDVANAKIEFERVEMWAGEVQLAKLVFQGMTQVVQEFRGFDWKPSELTLGPWLKHDEKRGVIDGNQVTVFEFPVRVQAPLKEGDYALEPGVVGITVQSASSGRSAFDLFRRSGSQRTIEAIAPDIKVKPLPAAPVDFSGAIGRFSISSKLVPQETAIGEPITWTVIVEGTGNWNDVIQLPNRQVPEGFEVIQPKSNTDMEDDSPFVGKITEDVVLIPTQEGTFTIPGLEMTYFDTNAGEYLTLKTDEKIVKVTAVKNSMLSPGGGTGKSQTTEVGTTPFPQSQSQSQVVPFDGQPQLPRDPLGYSVSTGTPFSLPVWILILLLPWMGVMSYWLWLAWQRVIKLDAVRSRRDALAALKSWRIDADSESDKLASLREWQRLVERLWSVSRPLPQASQLKYAVESNGGDDEEWAWLWNACERVLFGKDEALPQDWESRFTLALQAVRLPRVKSSGFLKPQVWLPLVMCACLLQSVTAQSVDAEMPLQGAETVYQAGEFSKSEAALRLRLEEDWGDSAAHHDLALALFQQERWDEAAAHASIAAIQSPSDESILWDVRLLTERAGWGATVTGKFFDEQNKVNRIFACRSVSFWQWLGVVCNFVLALSVVWGLTASYQQVNAKRGLRWSIAILGLVGLLFAILCVERWGLLGHPQAILVVEEIEAKSIPSEVDQQTRPLPVGTIAYFEKDFLGWRKVMLLNREEVWVREQDIVKIYP